MGVAEMQRHFTAYGSGELPEIQLRNLIRSALSREPQLSPDLIALTEACRRANLIDAKLQSTINADIVEVTGPSFDLTMVRSLGPDARDRAWFADDHAANSTDVHVPTGVRGARLEPAIGNTGRLAMGNFGYPSVTGNAAHPVVTGSEPVRTGSNGGPAAGLNGGSVASSTGGSAWDITDRLSEVGAPLYPGAVLRDRFVLVEELGRGGMGVVYKAYDRSRGDVKDRYVAIKVLSEEFKRHPLAVKALQREARKAQKLAHPNIVGVHDFDRDGGNVFMVMELLSGHSLDQVLRDDGQGGIPLGPALEIIKCLAAALSYAHEQDIVHCDFKPSNAFLGRDGRVKVLDFGIARAAPSLAAKGDVTLFDAGQLGAVSPAYASLELLQGEQPDIRDDVYSFACVVYELLTGVHPYQRIDAVKAFQTGLEPRPVRKLSRSQWRALKQGLAFRRVDRCSSVEVLARQLLAPQARTGFWVAVGAAGLGAAGLIGLLVWKGPAVERVASGWIQQLRAPHAATVTHAAKSPSPVPPQGPVTPQYGATTQQGVTPQSAAPVAVAPPPATSTAEPALPSAAAPTAPTPSAAALAPTPSAAATSLTPSTPAPASLSSPDESPAAPAGERRHVEIEMLKEQFETQAIGGDVENAGKAATALGRAAAGSAYVTNDVPRILALAYVHRAKTQFAAGQVNEAMQTLAEGRRKFGRSTELRDQEVKYVAAADLYDRMSSAVVLNVNETKRALDELKGAEGDEFDATAQMLAQTLADRIADHRAAGRDPVADKLSEAGRQIFPDYAEILGRGSAGKLSGTPIQVNPE